MITLMTNNLYRVVLADPPWEYNVYNASKAAQKSRAATAHYPTMKIDAIKSLTIPSDDNCALFLWVTPPCMEWGFEVIKAWGFKYKTIAFTWIKTTKNGSPAFGMGYYTRGNAELCLLGIRGKMPVNSHSVSQVIMSERREHSRKPEQQYARIEQLYNGPYIELFARQQRDGWDQWGNDTNKFD